MILDYLTVPDLLRFARVSKRMQEMVYDDFRWIQRLKLMGCWNETEARERAEGSIGEDTDLDPPREEGHRLRNAGIHGRSLVPNRADTIRPAASSAAVQAQQRQALRAVFTGDSHRQVEDGFDATTLSSPDSSSKPTMYGPDLALHIFKMVRSIRNQAREEYGKVYRALAPFYNNVVQSTSIIEVLIFKTYTTPQEQAQILSELYCFSKSDFALGSLNRQARLEAVLHDFENAAVQEFRRGYENHDIDGQMRQYAYVLGVLNGGQASIDTFIRYNHLITEKDRLGQPADCLDYSSGHGFISLERTQAFFNRLTVAFGEEQSIIIRAFPQSGNVTRPFVAKVGREVLSPYLTSLYDEAHARGTETYLKAVSGTFAQTLHFVRGIQSDRLSKDEMDDLIHDTLIGVFEPHLDLYLAEELDFFRQQSDTEVDSWDRTLSEQAASTETFLMSKFNRQADKKDFLTSFKKVVMMPVNILPSFPALTTSRPPPKAAISGGTQENDGDIVGEFQIRPSSPTPWTSSGSNPSHPSTPHQEAPSTELAAKVALMNSKLEGIRSLFSIEVALNLVHRAKQSLERAAQFTKLRAPYGVTAQRQCEAIFVQLLQILGIRHVKCGFDKAVDHLSNYSPRGASGHDQPGVQPLVTFLELVNVGDLIQQMVDVFYEQELIGTKFTDRSDFLDPAVKEKKKFEQMLDERVAAGLNKGIDVLMDEVEYICATTQLPTDFNPATDNVDVRPSETAQRIVNIVSSHTNMLIGSTDKALLDVFNQEVGLRLFTVLCKHLKRQRISTTGSVKLISDMSHYFQYIQTLKNPDLLLYFTALRELSQIYLIDAEDAKEMATIIADVDRFHGIFRAEEVYEFAERRVDWYQVKGRVEKAMYGVGCSVM